MNKKFWKKNLIYFIIFLILVFTINWLIKSQETRRNKNQTENFNVYYKQLLSNCGEEKAARDCCFNSVSYMSANNLKTAGIGCGPGYKLNTFNCPGSLKWCEMKR